MTDKPVEPSSSDVGMWKDEKDQLEFAIALTESIAESSKDEKIIMGSPTIWGRIKRNIGFCILWLCISIFSFIVGWMVAEWLKG